MHSPVQVFVLECVRGVLVFLEGYGMESFGAVDGFGGASDCRKTMTRNQQWPD